MEIIAAKTKLDVTACFPAFKELRPHLIETEFISQVFRQMKNHNYEIVFIKEKGIVVSAAGYRVAEYLAWGMIFYVDDLITLSSARQSGYANVIMDWLIAKAKALGCKEFHLDSGTHRHDAHRLYARKKLNISSLHFSNEVDKLKVV